MSRFSPKALKDLEVFYGRWCDSMDNDIAVKDGRRKDELLVTFYPRFEGRKGPREPYDLILKAAVNGEFFCGCYVLDHAKSHSERLVWVGKLTSRNAGDLSIWTRPGTPQPSNGETQGLQTKPRPSKAEIESHVEFMIYRLVDIVNQSKSVRQQLREKPGDKLHRYILDAADGRYDRASWDDLSVSSKKDLLEICRFDNLRDAAEYVYNLICSEEQQLSSLSFCKFMAQMERGITTIVAKQPSVGTFIVEKAHSSILHKFLKDVVRANQKAAYSSWIHFDEKVREDIQSCIATGETAESNDALLRIIDPDGHISSEIHTPAVPHEWQDTNGALNSREPDTVACA